jgi:hypothetical protein
MNNHQQLVAVLVQKLFAVMMVGGARSLHQPSGSPHRAPAVFCDVINAVAEFMVRSEPSESASLTNVFFVKSKTPPQQRTIASTFFRSTDSCTWLHVLEAWSHTSISVVSPIGEGGCGGLPPAKMVTCDQDTHRYMFVYMVSETLRGVNL